MSEMTSNKVVSVKVAGLLYILVILIGVLNSIFIDSRLIVTEEINLTINNIIANEFLFRFGSICVLILYVSVIILSVLLYLILKSVNKNLALLAIVLRLGEGLLGITTVLLSFTVLSLLNNQPDMMSVDATQVNILVAALLETRAAGLFIILLLVGSGGTLFFYLFYKSRYIPKILSIWGMFTYTSMIILSITSLLFPELPDKIAFILYGLGSLFELTIGFWLLIKGINVH